MNTIIDGHLHVYAKDKNAFPWANAKAAAPPEPAEAADYLRIADRAGITRAVLLQPGAYALDSRYMRSVVDMYPDRFRFMVIADYRDAAGYAVLEKEAADSRMCGARLNLMGDDRPADALAKDDAVLRAAGALAGREKIVDLHVRLDQFGLVEALAARFPDARFIVDHMGYPEPSESVPDSYAAAVGNLASLGNVYFKLSGYEMKSKTGFPFTDMMGFARCILEKAGPARCLWASNYPFVNLAAGVEQALSLVDGLAGGDEEVKADLLYRTAESLFWKGRQ